MTVAQKNIQNVVSELNISKRPATCKTLPVNNSNFPSGIPFTSNFRYLELFRRAHVQIKIGGKLHVPGDEVAII